MLISKHSLRLCFFFLERKLSFQESLFTAVSNEVNLTSYVQVVVEEIIFQLHGSIFTVLGYSLEKNCN